MIVSARRAGIRDECANRKLKRKLLLKVINQAMLSIELMNYRHASTVLAWRVPLLHECQYFSHSLETVIKRLEPRGSERNGDR